MTATTSDEARELLAAELDAEFPDLATGHQVRHDAEEFLDVETLCALRAITKALSRPPSGELFFDRPKRRLYVFPLPCFGVVVQFGKGAK